MEQFLDPVNGANLTLRKRFILVQRKTASIRTSAILASSVRGFIEGMIRYVIDAMLDNYNEASKVDSRTASRKLCPKGWD